MRIARLAALAAVLVLTGSTLAAAQNAATHLRRTVYIPALLLGPDRFGPFQRLCSLRVVGLAEWRMSVIESTIKPDEAQKAALADLQAASAEARHAVSSACSRKRPATSVGELEEMGKRLDAVTQAFKTVRPAYEALYAKLDERQRASIDALGPQRQGWRW